jgi:hypothetical protein
MENKSKKLAQNPPFCKADVSGSLHHPIKFGRWLLKYAKEGWDEGLLCWQYEGKFYNTDELYEEFCRQQ